MAAYHKHMLCDEKGMPILDVDGKPTYSELVLMQKGKQCKGCLTVIG